MNKYKILGAALMSAILMLIGSSHFLGLTAIDVMASSYAEFLHGLSILCITLFGSFAALTLDKLN